MLAPLKESYLLNDRFYVHADTDTHVSELPNFSRMKPSDLEVCPGAYRVNTPLVSYLQDQIHAFTRMFEIAAQNQVFPNAIARRYSYNEAVKHRSQFQDVMRKVYDIADGYGVIPKTGFALYGAFALVQDSIEAHHERASQFYPIFMEAKIEDGVRKVSVSKIDSALEEGLVIYVDHVIRSGHTLGRFLKSRSSSSRLETLLSKLEQRQLFPSELLENEVEELVSILEESQVVVATPYIKNPILRKKLLERSLCNVSQPWAAMQRDFAENMIELDEFSTILGANMWDIGLEPEELKVYLPPEVYNFLDSLGLIQIRLLRLAGNLGDMWEIRVEDLDYYKRKFAQQIESSYHELFRHNGYETQVFPLPEHILHHTPAVILCGGLGMRLKEETGDNIPKPLIELSRSTHLIEPIVAQLELSGASPIIFATSSLSVNHIRHLFTRNKKYTSRFLYSVEDEAQGVINAVLQAMDLYCLNDKSFILCHGDEIVPGVNLHDMMKQHIQTTADATIVVTQHPYAGNSYVGWLDHTNRLTSMKRNPSINEKKGGFTMTGLFIFAPQVFRKIASRSKDWDTLMRNTISTGRFYGFVTKDRFYNTNTPHDLTQARVLIARGDIYTPN